MVNAKKTRWGGERRRLGAPSTPLLNPRRVRGFNRGKKAFWADTMWNICTLFASHNDCWCVCTGCSSGGWADRAWSRRLWIAAESSTPLPPHPIVICSHFPPSDKTIPHGGEGQGGSSDKSWIELGLPLCPCSKSWTATPPSSPLGSAQITPVFKTLFPEDVLSKSQKRGFCKMTSPSLCLNSTRERQLIWKAPLSFCTLHAGTTPSPTPWPWVKNKRVSEMDDLSWMGEDRLLKEPWPSHTNHACCSWRPFWWLNWFVGRL